MKYQSKVALLLLLITALSQVSYAGMKETIENEITENQFEIIEDEGFVTEETKKEGLVISGSLGPQFVFENKKEQWGRNKSYQYSPVVGVISFPEYDLSTTLEIKRAINKWQPLTGKERINKSWEFQIQPRYYLGYYLGAPTDLVGEINTILEKRPDNGKYEETELFIGFAQRRPNLYSEVRYAHLYTLTDDAWNDNIRTQGDGFDLTIKPFIQKGAYQLETEFYYKLQQRWNLPTGWGQTYTEYHITPGIIYDFGGGHKLSFRTEFGLKKEEKKGVNVDDEMFYWKATLGYDFMITENLGGLIELEYERDKKSRTGNPVLEKTTIKKVTAALNYRF